MYKETTQGGIINGDKHTHIHHHHHYPTPEPKQDELLDLLKRILKLILNKILKRKSPL